MAGAVTIILVVGCSTTSAPTSAPAGTGPVVAAGTAVAGSYWDGTDLLWDVAADPNGFVAVGNSGVIVTSPEGSSWARQSAVTNQTLRSVRAIDGMDVAVGTGGTVVTWSSASASSASSGSLAAEKPLVRATALPSVLQGVAKLGPTWIVAGSGGLIATSALTHLKPPRSPIRCLT